jgi:hypothetical protein
MILCDAVSFAALEVTKVLYSALQRQWRMELRTLLEPWSFQRGNPICASKVQYSSVQRKNPISYDHFLHGSKTICMLLQSSSLQLVHGANAILLLSFCLSCSISFSISVAVSVSISVCAYESLSRALLWLPVAECDRNHDGIVPQIKSLMLESLSFECQTVWHYDLVVSPTLFCLRRTLDCQRIWMYQR